MKVSSLDSFNARQKKQFVISFLPLSIVLLCWRKGSTVYAVWMVLCLFSRTLGIMTDQGQNHLQRLLISIKVCTPGAKTASDSPPTPNSDLIAGVCLFCGLKLNPFRSFELNTWIRPWTRQMTFFLPPSSFGTSWVHASETTLTVRLTIRSEHSAALERVKDNIKMSLKKNNNVISQKYLPSLLFQGQLWPHSLCESRRQPVLWGRVTRAACVYRNIFHTTECEVLNMEMRAMPRHGINREWEFHVQTGWGFFFPF